MDDAKRRADGGQGPRCELFSFGYKHGAPEADNVLDVRFLPNPYWVEQLRPLTGTDAAVAAHALDNPGGKALLSHLVPLLTLLLELQLQAGKDFRFAVGCTGGRHRSVAVVEQLRARLGPRHPMLRCYHRDVTRE